MKKQWISVKCGLSRDPKHARRMGKAIWTFLHILDLADWETGIVYDWKDENAAEDRGVDVRVLRDERRRLEDEGYISCKQKQYGQDITIHNWTNPREYSGEVYNKKQGGEKYPPSKDVQGDVQGDAQGSIKDVSPTLDSKNQIPNGESINSPYIPSTQPTVSLSEKEKRTKQDVIDFHLGIANFPGAKQLARVNSILSYLGETFHKNTETKEWREFAKYIDGEKWSKGWDVKDFVKWLYAQKNFDLQYWPVKKMYENYPAAFVKEQPITLEDSGWK